MSTERERANVTTRTEWWALGHPAWPGGLSFVSLEQMLDWYRTDGHAAVDGHGRRYRPAVRFQRRVIMTETIELPS